MADSFPALSLVAPALCRHTSSGCPMKPLWLKDWSPPDPHAETSRVEPPNSCQVLDCKGCEYLHTEPAGFWQDLDTGLENPSLLNDVEISELKTLIQKWQNPEREMKTHLSPLRTDILEPLKLYFWDPCVVFTVVWPHTGTYPPSCFAPEGETHKSLTLTSMCQQLSNSIYSYLPSYF